MTAIRRLSFLSAMMLLGCQGYHAMPLSQPAVEAVIEPAPDTVLQSKVDELSHPTLKPVTIDFRDGLTPDAAAVVAVICNPSLRAIRDQHALAGAQLLQASLLPNPTLDATLDPVSGGNTFGSVTGYSVGPSWEVTALISQEAKVAAARAGAESARLDIAWQEWQIAMAAKKAACDLMCLDAQLDALLAVNQRLTENEAIIRAAVESHDRTAVDLAAAEAARQKAYSDAVAAQRDFDQQQLALNRALGLPPGRSIRVCKINAIPATMQIQSEGELLKSLESNRLDLVALRRGYEAQEQTLRVAVLSQFPKIVIGFHQASDTTNVHTTGFGVTIDLPIFDQQQGAIAIESATRQKLFDEYAGRLFDARADIAQSVAAIRSLTRQIAATEIEIPALQTLVDTYEVASEQHNLDVFSYYGARNDLAQKRVDLLKLRQQLLDNAVALELASGRFISEPTAPRPATRPPTTEGTR